MHLKGININDEYFYDILNHIKKHLPFFETIFDEEDIYPIMFEFGSYLIANYENQDVLKSSASFIDEAIEQGTSLTEDLIVLQVFHLLYEQKTKYSKFEKFLSPKSKSIYERCYRKWLKG